MKKQTISERYKVRLEMYTFKYLKNTKIAEIINK